MSRFAIDDLKTMTDTMVVVEDRLLVYDEAINATLDEMECDGYYDEEELEALDTNRDHLMNTRNNLLTLMDAVTAHPHDRVS